MSLRFLLIFFIVSACALSPGFKKEPTSRNPKNMGLRQTGVTLNFYNLNKINTASFPRIEDVKKKIYEEWSLVNGRLINFQSIDTNRDESIDWDELTVVLQMFKQDCPDGK